MRQSQISGRLKAAMFGGFLYAVFLGAEMYKQLQARPNCEFTFKATNITDFNDPTCELDAKAIINPTSSDRLTITMTALEFEPCDVYLLKREGNEYLHTSHTIDYCNLFVRKEGDDVVVSTVMQDVTDATSGHKGGIVNVNKLTGDPTQLPIAPHR